MKKTINQRDFNDAFLQMERNDNFSYEGKKALFEWLEFFEQDTGEQIELDVVSLCCDFTEYATALKAVENYSSFEIDNELNEKEKEKEALDFLENNTSVINFSEGIIIQNF
jgi:hypothetical protein